MLSRPPTHKHPFCPRLNPPFPWLWQEKMNIGSCWCSRPHFQQNNSGLALVNEQKIPPKCLFSLEPQRGACGRAAEWSLLSSERNKSKKGDEWPFFRQGRHWTPELSTPIKRRVKRNNLTVHWLLIYCKEILTLNSPYQQLLSPVLGWTEIFLKSLPLQCSS